MHCSFLHIILHIVHIILHIFTFEITYFAYFAYFAYCNMQNMDSALFLHFILHILYMFLHIYANPKSNMQKNMQTPKPICRIVHCPYSACW